MTSVTSLLHSSPLSRLTNHVDQDETTQTLCNHNSSSHNHKGKSYPQNNDRIHQSSLHAFSNPPDNRASIHSATTQGCSLVSEVTTSGTSKNMRNRQVREEGQSMPDHRRAAGQMERHQPDVGRNKPVGNHVESEASHSSNRRSSREYHEGDESFGTGHRSRNTARYRSDDGAQATSSLRRRSSVSRNTEVDSSPSGQSSKYCDSNCSETPRQRRRSRHHEVEDNVDSKDQIRSSRQYESGSRHSHGEIRRSRPSDPTEYPPGQIRPSRYNYDTNYDSEERMHGAARTHGSYQDSHEQRRDSSTQNDSLRYGPGQIRRSSLNRETDNETVRSRRNSGENREPPVSSRRHSVSRSDSTGEYGRKFRSRTSSRSSIEQRDNHVEAKEEPVDSNVSSRESQQPRPRRSDVKRSMSRSSSIERSSDMETEYFNRERRPTASRVRGRKNEEDVYHQEQSHGNSRMRDANVQKYDRSSAREQERQRPHRSVPAQQGENRRYDNYNRENDRETAHRTSHETQCQTRRGSSHTYENTENVQANYQRRRSSKHAIDEDYSGSARSSRHPRHGRDDDRREDPCRENNKEFIRARRRRSHSVNADAECEAECAVSRDSCYSLASQKSRQNPQLAKAHQTEATATDKNDQAHGKQHHPRSVKTPRSSTRRRSSCSHEDEGGPSTFSAGSFSRRSSSSKSNQDTGFVSSPSSPRREDSHPKYLSDASPSLHGLKDDDALKKHETDRRRHRSKTASSNNHDVRHRTHRHEQSLSSSGRGDSSFDEPALEENFDNKKSQHMPSSRDQAGVDGSDSRQTRTEINENFNDGAQYAIIDEIQKLNNANSKDAAIMSSSAGCSSSTLNKDGYESANALYCSTSTLKGASHTSKTSIAGSISSLFGRNRDDNQAPQSVSERWRKLKQDLMTDNDPKSIADSGKEKAVALFSAAATKLMSSLSSMSTAFPGAQEPKPADVQPFKSDISTNHNRIKENGTIDPKPCPAKAIPTETTKNDKADSTRKGSAASLTPSTLSHNRLASQGKSEDNGASHIPTTVSTLPTKPGQTSSRISTTSLSNVSEAAKTPTTASATRCTASATHRPSTVSVELASHARRADVYAAMTEKAASDVSDSEDSGQMVSTQTTKALQFEVFLRLE
ncbi:hypothetical protein PoB_004062500 [Plakobranchus ocellatus]|uniref:Uncharacterized protein n=1 Tax=Plakobranchus ocellatus TaxID=259542 RepID=A0AAV4B3H7_9GAST|nr:hypothetical protein PoB_004062500 [Plakobranchus ocellatus]